MLFVDGIMTALRVLCCSDEVNKIATNDGNASETASDYQQQPSDHLNSVYLPPPPMHPQNEDAIEAPKELCGTGTDYNNVNGNIETFAIGSTTTDLLAEDPLNSNNVHDSQAAEACQLASDFFYQPPPPFHGSNNVELDAGATLEQPVMAAVGDPVEASPSLCCPINIGQISVPPQQHQHSQEGAAECRDAYNVVNCAGETGSGGASDAQIGNEDSRIDDVEVVSGVTQPIDGSCSNDEQAVSLVYTCGRWHWHSLPAGIQ